MIGLEHYIVVGTVLFVLGVLGIFLNRTNVIVDVMGFYATSDGPAGERDRHPDGDRTDPVGG